MTSPPKERLDVLLVARGWAETREKAQRMIRAGQVRLATRVLDKPGVQVDPAAPIECAGLHDRFASRGGWKLEGAFEAFSALSPCPAVCADLGASTGGFTDCLLQHGAQRVYAIDVGAGQLDSRLRTDARVVVLDRTNARFLTEESLPERAGLVVGDLSFISLGLVLGPARRLLGSGGRGLFLVKPQFEAGRGRVGRGGVVRDARTHCEVLRRVLEEFVPAAGFAALGLTPSPLTGPAGNHEYLLWLGRADEAAAAVGVPEIEAAVARALGSGGRSGESPGEPDGAAAAAE